MLGETIGNFRIVSKIGRGGMGEVYAAEQVSVHTPVAIKILLPEVSLDEQQRTRFFNEARAVSRIKHAGIAKIFDVGIHAPTGRAYLIMELLEGETLGARLARGGRLTAWQVADIGKQIASVLEATQAAGITHRDLKPDNIFLVPDVELDSKERVKILDFGIAKLATGAPGTTTGSMGTPTYMAPEQWRSSANVDWRSDAYSLGCLTFEMACGRPPFVADSVGAACTMHLHDPPPAARSLVAALPPALDVLLAKLLAKDPDQRPESMAAIGRAFAALRTGEPPTVATTQPGGRVLVPSLDPTINDTTLGAAASMSSRDLPRPKRTGWLIAALGVAAALGGASWLVFHDRTPDAATPSAGPVVAAITPPPIKGSLPPPPVIEPSPNAWVRVESAAACGRARRRHRSRARRSAWLPARAPHHRARLALRAAGARGHVVRAATVARAEPERGPADAAGVGRRSADARAPPGDRRDVDDRVRVLQVARRLAAERGAVGVRGARHRQAAESVGHARRSISRSRTRSPATTRSRCR